MTLEILNESEHPLFKSKSTYKIIVQNCLVDSNGEKFTLNSYGFTGDIATTTVEYAKRNKKQCEPNTPESKKFRENLFRFIVLNAHQDKDKKSIRFLCRLGYKTKQQRFDLYKLVQGY